jgi:hypothetical protein
VRHFHYFGYKFVSVTSFDGLPIMYELVAANIDEIDAAEDVFDYLRHCAMFGDKGLDRRRLASRSQRTNWQSHLDHEACQSERAEPAVVQPPFK